MNVGDRILVKSKAFPKGIGLQEVTILEISNSGEYYKVSSPEKYDAWWLSKAAYEVLEVLKND